MEYKAEVVDGALNIKARVEVKEDGSRIIHIPSLKVITKFMEGKNGKRNL